MDEAELPTGIAFGKHSVSYSPACRQRALCPGLSNTGKTMMEFNQYLPREGFQPPQCLAAHNYPVPLLITSRNCIIA